MTTRTRVRKRGSLVLVFAGNTGFNSLDRIVLLWNNGGVAWEVEYTDEFGEWWAGLLEPEQIKIDAMVRLLEELRPDLPYPMSSGVHASRHAHMRELRIQIQGRPFRVLYAFNPKRTAILLVGGDKTGDDRWYQINVPIADRLYNQHLRELAGQAKPEEQGNGQEVQ